jgi:hypothetical protein
MTRIGGFVLQFLEAACEAAGGAVYRHADTGTTAPSYSGDADLCWFPTETSAESWASLHQPVSLAKLISLPDQISFESLSQVLLDPPSFNCFNGQKQIGTINLSASNGVSVQRVSISGQGFALIGTAQGRLPMRIMVAFAPLGLDWGPVSALVTIIAENSGHELAPETISLLGIVEGPAIPIPRVLYMGVVTPRETVRKTVRLKLSGVGAHVTEITSPPGIVAKLNKIEDSEDLALQITWTPLDRLGSMSGEIRIGFDLPQKGILRIPVVGVVKRPTS